ncbi:hypothetical protein AYO38_12050 [bacterium SCGC AG-212-C10]|nr:hypothetical protein AYO38_12050 [bacterium SCGC AG-212-C10]
MAALELILPLLTLAACAGFFVLVRSPGAGNEGPGAAVTAPAGRSNAAAESPGSAITNSLNSERVFYIVESRADAGTSVASDGQPVQFVWPGTGNSLAISIRDHNSILASLGQPEFNVVLIISPQ